MHVQDTNVVRGSPQGEACGSTAPELDVNIGSAVGAPEGKGGLVAVIEPAGTHTRPVADSPAAYEAVGGCLSSLAATVPQPITKVRGMLPARACCPTCPSGTWMLHD